MAGVRTQEKFSTDLPPTMPFPGPLTGLAAKIAHRVDPELIPRFEARRIAFYASGFYWNQVLSPKSLKQFDRIGATRVHGKSKTPHKAEIFAGRCVNQAQIGLTF
jgi:hypothetical protein